MSFRVLLLVVVVVVVVVLPQINFTVSFFFEIILNLYQRHAKITTDNSKTVSTSLIKSSSSNSSSNFLSNKFYSFIFFEIICTVSKTSCQDHHRQFED